MNVTDNTMETLIAMRLEDLADRVAYHYDNGDLELAQLLKAEGLALAEAFDDCDTILVAEALF
jgi:hypothetical protein